MQLNTKKQTVDTHDRVKKSAVFFYNQKIKDKAPNDYVHMMNSDSIPTILESAICPPNTFEMPYEDFIKVRSTLLLEYANKLISL